ncbi:hypothetical protein Plec18167_005049 [Paecilomyces lecythidis]|uniref:Uncharacterized protein n=1 Tax=Paecilomyces lecythidis TaxID=3004212 RepID=A0ABR3XME7_9EURO
MKFTTTILAALFSLVAVSAASPTAFTPVDNVLEARKGCSGDRTEDDICGGKKLQAQNSFHNCKNSGGKCCASNSDGSGGLDVKNGLGREDCGYCFSGKCS